MPSANAALKPKEAADSLAAVARQGGVRVREDITIDGVTVRLYAPRG